ncbi:histone-like nucleoid-structuring protein Lsr2 [Catelliglobosispora koreensis]|uniref:histone-like nucleoid-structuring protein Lsr2 n=1 Tax=Catelliglobosispora koreensis TaxID=129052 RepID=UPI00037B85CF|nr:Lsr2 family protein [Catelliglobosispora koreensis]
MARREIVVLQDDLDGSEKDVRVVKFGFEGVSYEIDLSPGNFDKLAQALAPFVAVARKDAKRAASGPAPRSKGLSAAEQRAFNQRVRDWAKTQKGQKVSERGRVPAKLIEAYHAAGLR